MALPPTLLMLASLAVWMGLFGTVYALLSLGCVLHWPMPVNLAGVGAIAALCLAAEGAIGWLAWRRRAEDPFAAKVAIICAALTAVATIFFGVGTLLTASCGAIVPATATGWFPPPPG